MAKAKFKKTVEVTHVKTAAVRCDICHETMVVRPGKNPVKVLAAHHKRKHQ